MKKKEVSYITVEEASLRLGISARRIQQLCRAGEIEDVYRSGKSWKVSEASLASFPIKKKNREKLKPLPIAVTDFEKAVNEYYYADKTLLIKEILDSKPNVLIFSRPHSFMKSLNLDMLRVYFEKNDGDTSSYFLDKEIWKCGHKYRDEQGQYPVMKISFKDLKGDDWKGSFAFIKEAIRQEYVRHGELKNSPRLSSFDKARFSSLFSLEGEDDEVLFSSSLALLADLLYKHYEKKPILLVDEYDAPFRGSLSNLDERAMPFLKELYANVLKDNSRLSYAFIFGTLEADKLGLFPSFKSDSLLDERYAPYFGFTEMEVKKLLAYYGYSNKWKVIKERYGGYSFGNRTLYNPWSVLNYVDDKCAYEKPYWNEERCDELLEEALRENDADTYLSLSSLMLDEGLLRSIDPKTLYPSVENNPQSIYAYLLMNGYLSKREAKSERGTLFIKGVIPNLEVKDLYADRIGESLSDIAPYKAKNGLEMALFEGKREKVASSIEKFLVDSLVSSDNSSPLYYPKLILSLSALFRDRYRLLYALEEEEGRLYLELYAKEEGRNYFILLEAAGRVGEEGLQKLSEEALEKMLSSHKEKGLYMGIAYSKKKAVTVKKNR